MKVYTLYTDVGEGTRFQRGSMFSTRAKAEEHVKHLKTTVFKNYGAAFEIREEKVY